MQFGCNLSGTYQSADNETVFAWGLSALIPRAFLAHAGMSDAAGLRSERSASIIQPDKTAFFNPAEYRPFLYLHRPAYRRHARAFGVHGERPVDDFGRVEVAVAVGRASVLAVPATAGLLASGAPVLGHPVGAAVGTSHVVSVCALSRHFNPFRCVGPDELYTASACKEYRRLNRLLSQRLQGAALLEGGAYLIFAIGFLYFLSTESYAILPAASVAGCCIARPSARYFSADRIGRDQLEDYARRKRIAPGEAERWPGGIVEG